MVLEHFRKVGFQFIDPKRFVPLPASKNEMFEEEGEKFALLIHTIRN